MDDFEPSSTGVQSPSGLTDAAEAARTNTKLSVRDIHEAREFYKQLFTFDEESASEDKLCMRFGDQYITCILQKGLGEDGRVCSTFRLANLRFVPVRHRIAVESNKWRAAVKNLRRAGIQHEINASRDADEHGLGGRHITLVDPSGNALEVLAISSAREGLWRRRWFKAALGGVGAIALTALLVYGIWRPAETINVSGNNTTVAFRHLP